MGKARNLRLRSLPGRLFASASKTRARPENGAASSVGDGIGVIAGVTRREDGGDPEAIFDSRPCAEVGEGFVMLREGVRVAE